MWWVVATKKSEIIFGKNITGEAGEHMTAAGIFIAGCGLS